jgi:hypothetical protein
MNSEERIPKVFISYSHDNPTHKRWVGEFASKLVQNGVDVILDQWDLGPGDDIAKFMEKSVSDGDRVLMICTEAYVKKADEGKGGVGYEAMIVTGELVRNLGSSKFIPIVRQASTDIALPRSVSTRFYVNLSESQDFDEQFEVLLRELHKAPAVKKPAIGKNPFALQPSGDEIPATAVQDKSIPNLGDFGQDVVSVYNAALDIARQGDIVAWRKIVRQAKQPTSEMLLKWRKIQDRNPPKTKDELPEAVLGGISSYAPLFAIALAGIESGRDKFNNQISILDEIANPRKWEYAGLSIIVRFPHTIAYIYQALHGAMCLATEQLNIAIRLARSKIKTTFDEKPQSLWLNHKLMGWPTTLGDDCKIAWDFMRILPERWGWLIEPFGEFYDYQSYLCAYYMSLNILELAETIASGKAEIISQEGGLSLYIPLCFLQEDEDIERKAYRLLLSDPEQVRDIWRNLGVTDSKMEELWPHWIRHVGQWLFNVSRRGFRDTIVHTDLFQDLQ